MAHLAKSIGSKMLVLSEKDVRRCLSMADCLAINRKALLSISGSASQVGGTGMVPSRLGLPGPPPAAAAGTSQTEAQSTADDWTLFKPAAFYGDNTTTTTTTTACLMGIKIVSIRSQNPEKGLPLVPATILVLDAETGIVQAVMDGTYLTGARTAASSGLATQLARPDLQSLVVFGAGLQAEMHLEAIQTAIGRAIPKITIVNRTRARAEQLKSKVMVSCGSSCNVVLLDDVAGVETALSTADVVVATTNTTTPLFDGKVLPPRCHINGIGSYTPEMQEIGPSAVNRSRIWIDTPEAKTVGDLKHLAKNHPNHPIQLLGDVLGNPEGWVAQGDGSQDCTFYKGVGTAIQDVMTADWVVQKARELGIGTNVDMS